MGIAIRPGTHDDLGEIVAIYNHYVLRTPVTFDLEAVTAADRAGWLDEHRAPGSHRIVVATGAGKEVVGWATTSAFRPRAGYSTTVEASIYLRPDQCGRGLGTRLYAHLFRSVQHEPIERIVAGITLPNPASEALHRRFGFRRIGVFTRIGRKFDRFWDVAWFERDREERSRPRNSGDRCRGPGAGRGEERALGPHFQPRAAVGAEDHPR